MKETAHRDEHSTIYFIILRPCNISFVNYKILTFNYVERQLSYFEGKGKGFWSVFLRITTNLNKRCPVTPNYNGSYKFLEIKIKLLG